MPSDTQAHPMRLRRRPSRTVSRVTVDSTDTDVDQGPQRRSAVTRRRQKRTRESASSDPDSLDSEDPDETNAREVRKLQISANMWWTKAKQKAARHNSGVQPPTMTVEVAYKNMISEAESVSTMIGQGEVFKLWMKHRQVARHKYNRNIAALSSFATTLTNDPATEKQEFEELTKIKAEARRVGLALRDTAACATTSLPTLLQPDMEVMPPLSLFGKVVKLVRRFV